MIKPLYLKYLTAIAIALSLNSIVKAQSTNTASDSIRERLTSEWERAVLTHSLESATEIGAIEFNPDGKLLAGVGASQITLWNLDKVEIQRVLLDATNEIIDVQLDRLLLRHHCVRLLPLNLVSDEPSKPDAALHRASYRRDNGLTLCQ